MAFLETIVFESPAVAEKQNWTNEANWTESEKAEEIQDTEQTEQLKLKNNLTRTMLNLIMQRSIVW